MKRKPVVNDWDSYREHEQAVDKAMEYLAGGRI